MNFNSTIAGVTFALALMAGSAASALSCSTSQSTFDLAAATAAACSEGNDNEAAINSLFGPSWTLAGKNDDTTSGDGFISIVEPSANGVTTGAWEISSLPSDIDVVFVLKAARGFGAFMIDTISGKWSITKLGEDNGRDLSHASVYYRDGDDPEPPVSPVPLPAAGWLLIGAMGGMAALRRKSKA